MAAMIPLKLTNAVITQFQSGDFLDITLGGTGAVTAAAARTNLGLAIGTNVEAWSAELDGIAALSVTGLVTRTAAGAYTGRTLTAGASNTLAITNGNGISGNPAFDLATVTQGSSGTTFLKVQINSYGQVINNTPVTTGDLTTLLNTTYLALSGGTMTGALILNADPTVALGAATKQYVDAAISGTGARATAYYATTTALPTNTYNNGSSGVGATLTGNSNGALAAIDGQTPVANDIILVKDEATSANNGLYILTQVGDGSHPYILTRATQADQTTELSGMLVAVDNGTANAGSLWLQTTKITAVGTTSMTWTEINKAADIQVVPPLNISGNTISILNNGISNALIRQSAALSVIGNSTNATANVADISTTSGSNGVFRESGGVLGFGSLVTANIGNSQITYAKIQNESAGTILGNGTGGAAAPQEITPSARFSLSSGVLDFATSGVTAGTYSSVTVDIYGRVTSGSSSISNQALVFSATNGEAGSISICTPVYVSASGTVKKAINTSSSTAFCVGIVNDTAIASSASGNIASGGVVTATTAQWDAVAGTTGGLTAGTRYFLGSTAGTLTTTPPSTAGSGLIVEIGIALSSTILILTIQQPIQL